MKGKNSNARYIRQDMENHNVCIAKYKAYHKYRCIQRQIWQCNLFSLKVIFVCFKCNYLAYDFKVTSPIPISKGRGKFRSVDNQFKIGTDKESEMVTQI